MYDIAIVGAGIVGLSTALALKNKKVVVIEAEDDIAKHQTGHNSGVIHSGLYYKPNSSRAKNCVVGREMMYQFCEKYNIPHERCGKIVVATDQEEIPRLNNLEKRGIENGLTGIKRLDEKGLKEYEPHVSGIAGLWIPQTGIVNYKVVADKYAELIKSNGNEIKLGWKFLGLKQGVLETTKGEIQAKIIINCGGLYSDRIAKLCGVDPEIQIVPFRGEYYRIVPNKQYLVKNLIYPVPDPKFPFLGVHFTRTIEGVVEAGPNAVLSLSRNGYNWSKISLKDITQFVSYPGFWKMAYNNWKTGFNEVYRSLCKRIFHKSLIRLIPELKIQDIVSFGSGVRAQALSRDGQLVDDFKIIKKDNMIHVLNAPSPAATSSLIIGETISDMIEK